MPRVESSRSVDTIVLDSSIHTRGRLLAFSREEESEYQCCDRVAKNALPLRSLSLSLSDSRALSLSVTAERVCRMKRARPLLSFSIDTMGEFGSARRRAHPRGGELVCANDGESRGRVEIDTICFGPASGN